MGTFFCSKKKKKKKKDEQLSFIKDVADFAMCLLPTTIQCEVQDQNTINLTRNVPQFFFFFRLSGLQPIAYSFRPKKADGLGIEVTWTPKSDWHLTSPYNITSESHIKVMRSKEVITI